MTARYHLTLYVKSKIHHTICCKLVILKCEFAMLNMHEGQSLCQKEEY